MPTVIPGIYPQAGVVGPNGQKVVGQRPSRLHSVARWQDANGTVLGDSLVTIDEAGNITTTGTVNGRNISQDGQNLDAALVAILRLPTADQKAALAGAVGVGQSPPSGSNPYVLDDDPRLTGGGGGGGINPPAGQIGGTTGSPTILGIRETGGPTLLTFSSIPDGTLLKRSGTSIVGQSTPFVNRGVVSAAGDVTVTASTTHVFVTSTAAARTITLPSALATPEGWEISVFDRSNAAGNPNKITVMPNGTDTINGVNAGIVIGIPGDHVSVMLLGGAWVITKAPSNVLNVAAFGKLYGDGVNDDYAVIQAALDAGPPPGTDPSGFRVFLPRGRYRISQTLILRRCIVFEGEGSGSFNGYGTTIVPDRFAEGIRISGVFDSGVTNMRADFAIVRNMVIDFPVGAQSTVWAPSTAYVLGDLVVATTDDPAHHCVFRCTTAGTSDSSQPDFASLSTGDTVVDGSVTWTAIELNGINVKVKSTVEDISILNSPGNGVYMRGSTSDSPSTNCNEFVWRRLTSMGANLNGFFIDGPDANAGYCEKLFATTARFWGVYDSSFLGNTHVAHDVDNCGLGAYHDDDPNAKNVWLGCYSESGQPPSRIEANSVVIGGLHGAGFDGVYMGRNIGASFSGDASFNVYGAQNGVELRLNDSSTNKYAFGFKHSSESGDIRIQRDTAPTGNGWWAWTWAGLDSYISYAIGGDQVGADPITGYDNKAQLWLRPSAWEGFFYLGFGRNAIGVTGGNTGFPTNANYKKGDWLFETYWDYQGHVGGTRDGLHGWQFDKTGAAPWAARWPFFGHANQQEKTNGVGSPYAIDLKRDAGITFTNQGASAKVYLTLPATSGGGLADEPEYVEYTFLCVDGDGIRVTSQDAPIRMGDKATASAGYLETTMVGASVTIKCHDSTMWYITKLTGEWTDGTTTFAAGGGATPHVVVDQTSHITLANSDVGKSFTNEGAGGGVTLTAPASPNVGFYVRLRVSEAQTMTLVMPTGHVGYVDDIIATASGGQIAANTVGCHLEAEYVGNSKWFISVSGSWVAS